jgi:hypothetical protein
MDEIKSRTLAHLCSTKGYEFLQCDINCNATLCSEVIPDYIPKRQILKFIKILLAREDHYLKEKYGKKEKIHN